LTVIEKAGNKKPKTKRLKLKAASPEKTYIDCQTKKQYSGAELQKGLVIDLTCDYDSAHLLHFKAL